MSNYEKLIVEAESFTAGCSRDRLELRLVDAIKELIGERDALVVHLEELPELRSLFDDIREERDELINAAARDDWLTTDCGRCDNIRKAKLAREGDWFNSMSSRMIVCPECGNKRCPKAAWHDNVCTRSNQPGQPGSDYA